MNVPTTAGLYFACRVEIEPVLYTQLVQLEELAAIHFFKLAKLPVQKRPGDTPEFSRYDISLTGRSRYYEVMVVNLMSLTKWLRDAGFTVLRYTLEEVVADSHINDVLQLLVQPQRDTT